MQDKRTDGPGPRAHPFSRAGRSDPGDAPELPVRLPSIELPKGGGALRAISERFNVTSATGTGTVSVDLGLPPGRGGFGPQLGLGYDSGGGNGPCGLGWSCGAGSIARKTSRGVPAYRDHEDTFVSAGGEDLVPVEAPVRIVEGGIDYDVQRFRPRVERSFARVERWRVAGAADPGHWRTYSSDDVRSIFGRTAAARVSDPRRPSDVFEWLLEEQWDGRGSAIHYVYKQEDLAGVDLQAPAELHRRPPNGSGAGGRRYLKRVLYGNATPLSDPGQPLANAAAPRWRFEVVFDYGEHPDDRAAESAPWRVRPDPFSRYRAGFELRTYRLMRRILVFHRFDALGPQAAAVGVLVTSTSLTYGHHVDDGLGGRRVVDDPVASKLLRVEQRGHRAGASASLPPVDFEYSPADWNPRLNVVERDARHRWPASVDGRRAQWVDLEGEGLPGALVSGPQGWWYEPPEGRGRLGPARLVREAPVSAPSDDGAGQLLDLQGDGRLDVVRWSPPTPGYYSQSALHGGAGRRTGFEAFRELDSVPHVDFADPNVRLLDVIGDGFADIVILEGDLLVCLRSKRAAGFDEAFRAPLPVDDGLGPRIVFADPRFSVFIADMSGDGLSDLVSVEPGGVSYWPNLGHGRFGARVTMSRPPALPAAGRFDPRRVRLADLDGTGPADLIYLGERGVTAFLNEAGNRWSSGREIEGLPPPDGLSDLTVVDLLGRGTACLVWSTDAPGSGPRLAYVDLFGRGDDDAAPPSAYKPHLLVRAVNNLGAETRVRYSPSTKFYLQTRGSPDEWVTRLHFPVQVVDRIEHEDAVSKVRLVQRFAYHHGYFDPEGREFNGFGYVEQWDEESHAPDRGSGHYDDAPNARPAGWVAPVYTRTWFHTGASRAADSLENAILGRAGPNPAGIGRLPTSVLPVGLTVGERARAHRALRGQMLRQEVYGLDGSAVEDEAYVIVESQVEVRRLWPAAGSRASVFTVVPRQTRTLHSERDGGSPRTVREVVLEVRPEDARYGHVRRTATIAVGRDQGPAAQTRTWVQSVESLVEHHDTVGATHRIRQPVRTRSWESLGVVAGPTTPVEALIAAIDAAPRRLLTEVETRYWNAARDGELAPGQSDPRGFVRRMRSLAAPANLHNAAFGAHTPGYAMAQWTDGGHEVVGQDVWVQTPVMRYLPPAQFNLPDRVVDPFGNTTRVHYDPDGLFVVRVDNALGHSTTSSIDYHALAVREVVDANLNHVEVAFDALGDLIAVARKGKALGGGQWEGRTLAAPHATYRYARTEWLDHRRPASVRAEVFTSHDPADASSQVSWTYFDGSAEEVLTKTQADPGISLMQDRLTGALVLDPLGQPQRTAPGAARWIGSGRIVSNHKGLPLKEYEPYFSSVPAFEDEPALAFDSPAAIFHYDPLGRLTRTQFPDGTEARVERGTWSEVSYDRSDTVAGSRWAADAGASADPAVQRALALSLPHAGTATTAHLDALGRTFRIDEDNGVAGAPDIHSTRLDLDILGRVSTLTDARGNIAGRLQYDLLGRVLSQSTADGGTRWTLPAVDGLTSRIWTERQHRFVQAYDALRRPIVRRQILPGGGAAVRVLAVYGEALGAAAAQAANQRGQLHRIYDGAGERVISRYDFDGHPLESRQRLRVTPAAAAPRAAWSDYALGADWSAAAAAPNLGARILAAEPLLEAEAFDQRATFDALGRAATSTSPDLSVAQFAYGTSGHLDRVDLRHGGGGAATPYVAEIRYDALGRRARIVYGQGVVTTYGYDPRSRRLTRIRTRRPGGGTILQDLRYTHDAAGNVVALFDGAQPATYFDNAVASSDRLFEYDARHRMVRAEGRCHPGQQPGRALPPNRNVPHANDGNTLQRYVQTYAYDAVGNLMQMAQRRGLGLAWRRRYQYALDSNRLLSTSASMVEPARADYADPAIDAPYVDGYGHDAHGNVTAMPGLGGCTWDAEDQLVEVALAGGGDAYYTYDAGGQRVRKTIRRLNGADVVERVYVEGWERYRRRVGGNLREAIETLHLMDDTRRVALVETKTTDGGVAVPNPAPRARYQLDDHLGTCTIELDGSPQARVLSYEEYYPYGAVSYRATRAGVDLSPKRYRYTTKERDEETGFDYFGDRYYAPWLGRWISADPEAEPDGSLFAYGALSPQGFVDPDGGKEIPIGFIYTLTRVTSSGAVQVYVGKAADIRQRLLATGNAEHHHFRDMIRRSDTQITARTVYADLQRTLPKRATKEALDKARNAALLVAEQDQLNRVRAKLPAGGKVLNAVEALAEENIDTYRSKFRVRSASGPAHVLKKEGQALSASKLSALERGKPPALLKLRSRLRPSPKRLGKKVPVVAIAFVGATFYSEGAEAAVVEGIDAFNPLAIVGLSIKAQYDENKAESRQRWDELLNDLAMMELESMLLEAQVAELEELPELVDKWDRWIEWRRRDIERGKKWERENLPARASGH